MGNVAICTDGCYFCGNDRGKDFCILSLKNYCDPVDCPDISLGGECIHGLSGGQIDSLAFYRRVLLEEGRRKEASDMLKKMTGTNLDFGN